MGYMPVPATSYVLCQYAAYLARTKAVGSIKQYLNVVRILHLEWGLPNPLSSNYQLSLILKGIQRVKGTKVSQKAPITPALLLKIFKFLNLSKGFDSCFWAACLIMFFTLLRRSNVFPPSFAKFDQNIHLCRGDFRFFPWGLRLNVRWSKTIQFGQRVLTFPLPYIPGHILCPVKAVYHAFSFVPSAPLSAPVWMLKSSQCLTVPQFVTHFKHLISLLGLNPDNYAGHSFRRGGAMWAYKYGVPTETIKILGDWQSLSYLNYVKSDSQVLFNSIQHIQSSLPTST